MSYWGWGVISVDMIIVNSIVVLDFYFFNNLALGLFDFIDVLYWGEKKFIYNL